MADLGKLPDNVLMEILLRLPPESLVRFKRVSKFWNTLLNDPIFFNSLSKRNILVKRLIWHEIRGDEGELKGHKGEIVFSTLKYPLTADDDTPVDVQDFHFPSLGGGVFLSRAHIRGHSHGIICFCFDPEYYIFLYNPATGDLRKLPPSILLISEEQEDEQENHIYGPYVDSSATDVGSGYDPKSEDFKVVRVVTFEPSDSFDYDDLLARVHHLAAIAEVYDLKKDEWREIESPVPGRAMSITPSSEMYYRGLYYWWARRLVDGVEIIQWFDMSEEVFGQISMPESLERIEDDRKYKSIGILNGSIVLFHHPIFDDFERNEKCFDVWEMVKLGDVVSWSKLFTIGPLSRISFPLAFVGFDQLLMVNADDKLVICDINTLKVKYFPLKGSWDKFQAIVFIKTLASVNGNGNGVFEGTNIYKL